MVRIVYHSYFVVCGPAVIISAVLFPTDPINLALLYQILLFYLRAKHTTALINYYINGADSL